MRDPETTASRQPQDGAGVTLERKVGALLSPVAYKQSPRRIETIETHYAWLFLADDHVFKLKKPVRFDQLDQSTLAARQFNCQEELRLNRRLAPQVYLAVEPLMSRADGTLHIGGSGAVVDWLVKMRRLPAALMLDRAIESGRIDRDALLAVGLRLASFYQAQQRMEFEPRDYVARIVSQIQSDRAALLAPELHIAEALVESVAAEQLRACAKLTQELMLRAQQHRVVEAHGDLRPEHICLSDPPCVIDSLEFSIDLRTLDPGEELAFLWVECARLGGAWVGELILDAYRSQSGDPITPELLDFYRSRRAAIRAKLVAWHLRDPAVRELSDWSRQTQEYLELARQYAAQASASRS